MKNQVQVKKNTSIVRMLAIQDSVTETLLDCSAAFGTEGVAIAKIYNGIRGDRARVRLVSMPAEISNCSLVQHKKKPRRLVLFCVQERLGHGRI